MAFVRQYASIPVAFRVADEIDSAAYIDVATSILRQLYASIKASCQRDETCLEQEPSFSWADGQGEVQKVAETSVECAERGDEEMHEEARDAMAMAQPVSLSDDDEPLEIVRLRASRPPEVTADPKSTARPVEESSHSESDATDSDTDSDVDSDSDSSDDDSEDDSPKSEPSTPSTSASSTSSISSYFMRPTLRRSPLARSIDGLHPVYAGYHCTIEGCEFKASTPQHVRHHILTASHCYLLDE